MKLIMVDCKSAIPNNDSSLKYFGMSTQEIESSLKNELFFEKYYFEELVIHTSDSRLLNITKKLGLSFDNMFYALQSLPPKPLQECTDRVLRNGHNLSKLFDAGEFNY